MGSKANRAALLLTAWVTAICSIAAAPPERPASRWAVLIASEGNASQTLPSQPGLVAQVEELARVLGSQYGYPPDSIQRLYNERTTGKNIYLAFSELRDRVARGDSVFIFLALPEVDVVRGKAPGHYWVPWDGREEEPWTLLSMADTAGTLAGLEGATIVNVTPSCIVEARENVLHRFSRLQSYQRAGSKTVLYNLSGCAGDLLKARFAELVTEALETGLGKNLQEFGSEDLASHLSRSAPEFRVEYLRQFDSAGGLTFVRERQALDAEILADLDPSEDMKVRSEAIWNLVDFVYAQPEDSRAALTEELAEVLLPLAESADESGVVRNVAVAAIARLGYEPAMPRIVEIARSGSGPVSAEAVGAIEALGGERAVDVLEELLQTGDPAVGTAAIEALTRLRSRRSLPAIVARMRDSDPAANLAALEAIQTLSTDPAEAIEMVGALLDQQPDDYEVRRQAIGTLGSFGDPRALPALERGLGDPDPRIVAAVGYAIAKIDVPTHQRAQVERALIEALGQDEVSTAAVAAALGRHGSERAVEPLVRAMNDLDRGSGARARLAAALGALGDPRAVPALLPLLDDRNPSTRRAASRALGELGDGGAIANLERVRVDDDDPYVRQAAATAIDEIRTKRYEEAPEEAVVDRIAVALGDRDYATRLRASEALATLPDDVVLEVIRNALGGDNPEARKAAAYHLERLPESEPALSMLLEQRDDPEPTVREAVWRSLGTFDDPRALEALRAGALNEPNGPARLSAAFSLQRQSQLRLDRDDVAIAREAAQLSLKTREEVLSTTMHPYVAQSYGALARVEIAAGDLDRAQEFLERSIVIADEFPEEDVTVYLRDAGRVSEMRGDLKRAEYLYIRVLETREKAFGPESSAVAQALEDVARVLRLSGDPGGAERFEMRAREIRERGSKALSKGSKR